MKACFETGYVTDKDRRIVPNDKFTCEIRNCNNKFCLIKVVNMNFNESQLGYLNETIDANTRLLAPAGCGKTITLLHRANRVVEDLKTRGIENPNILIVTFTNTARFELESKISEDNLAAENLTVCTLNKWGTEKIMKHFKPTGFKKSFTWLDVSNKNDIKDWYNAYKGKVKQKTVLYNKLVEKAGKNTPFPLRAAQLDTAVGMLLFSLFEAVKDVGISWEYATSYASFMTDIDEKEHDEIITGKIKTRLYQAFENIIPLFSINTDEDKKLVEEFIVLFGDLSIDQFSRTNQGYFSFTDQKYWPLQYIRAGNPDFFEPYDHIFVDEFQDINALDLQLIKTISEYSQKQNGRGFVSVVGDADQAIFEWRGAVPDYIINCDKYLPNLLTHQLDRNYRMPKNIVKYSQELIKNNEITGYERKAVIPMKLESAKITLLKGSDPIELAKKCISYASQLREDGMRVAILGRKRSQLVLCQTLMIQEGIQYFIDADINLVLGTSFSNLLLCLENHHADINTKMPSVYVADAIIDFAQAWLGLVWDDFIRTRIRTQMLQIKFPTTISQALEFGSRGGWPGLFWGVDNNLYSDILDFYNTKTVYDALSVLSNQFKGFKKLSGVANNDDIFRLDPPFELMMDYSVEFDSDFENFTEIIKKSAGGIQLLNSNTHTEDTVIHNEINLMTATRSKGREFDCVIMLDVVDNIWPCFNPTNDPINMDEERRLFYVAMTRAKKELVLTIPETYGSRVVDKSPFIAECKFEDDVIIQHLS